MTRLSRLLILLLVVLAAALAPVPRAAGQGAGPEELPEDVDCTMCHEDRVTGESIHMPAASDCTTCHEQEDATKHVFALALPPEELCGMCHDDVAGEGTVHFPVAQGACGSCHDAHASEHAALLKAEPAELCASCHDPVPGADAAHVHGPVALGMCGSCHAPHSSASPALLLADGPELCLGCHDDLAPPGEGELRWHLPVQQDCSSCHAGHGSEAPGLLHEAQPAACTGCHDVATSHSPTTQGDSCTGCHDPHATRRGAFLREDERALCLSCHDREVPAEGDRTVRDIAVEIGGDRSLHGPIALDRCAPCHDPHGNGERAFLPAEYPSAFYVPFEAGRYALCFSCHDPALVTRERTRATGFRDGDRNLHHLHVNRTKGRSCRVCHTTHASAGPKQVRESVPFGRWTLPIGFEAREDGGTCASGCHVREDYAR